MKICFYEEFPTKRNIEKCRLINFNTELFVAAPNLRRFYARRKRIQTMNPLCEVHYWPLLRKYEGYWISPFSDRKALNRVMNELRSDKGHMKVVWDLEPPILRSSLFWRNLTVFLVNKRAITGFVNDALLSNKELLLTENVITGSRTVGSIFGLYFDPRKYHAQKTLMYYSSLLRYATVRNLFLDAIRREHEMIGDRLSVALGTIASGIHGSEQILSPKELDRDLRMMREMGIDEVIIFRLGGLTREYLKVIQRYLS
jgi:hypothetical protein